MKNYLRAFMFLFVNIGYFMNLRTIKTLLRNNVYLNQLSNNEFSYMAMRNFNAWYKLIFISIIVLDILIITTWIAEKIADKKKEN